MQISIVMPTLNQAKFIDTSLRSIFDQTSADLEVIVIDGLSSDGTIEILKKWEAKYPKQFKWTSQKDSGPAEAINHGLDLAEGDIIGWLNSDDLYNKDTFKKVTDFFKKHPTKKMLYGNANHIDEKGDVIDSYPTKKPDTPFESFLEGSII
jgi:glycosyltransferase involved in cell wall biosynthesis